jgi:hypothetical protein
VHELEFEDVFDENSDIESMADTRTVNWVAALRGQSAYWQGRCEVLEAELSRNAAVHREALEELRRTHEDGAKRVDAANQIILGYLKDRLNRLEAKGSSHDEP